MLRHKGNHQIIKRELIIHRKLKHMDFKSSASLQALVFFIVGSAFTTIYITQPVLPILQMEFGVNETIASLTISAVVFGIALSNLPLGIISDLYSIKPIILIGGSAVSICGFICSITTNITLLIITRFIQGLFIPTLTTCIAAYLANTLPKKHLNVVMGSYVSATVAGGLGGRLLGGWIHPPLHWRFAFVSASALLLTSTIAASKFLPAEIKQIKTDIQTTGFIKLLSQKDLFAIFSVAFSSFFVFSSIFNYLPFYLSGPYFNAPTEVITFMYLSYIIGIIMGPLSGKISNRIGNGATMAGGSIIFAISIGITLIKSIAIIVISLAGVCAGFFAIHASAAGSLNCKLNSSRGRANSLYVLFYYLGGFSGITLSGYAYMLKGWLGVAILGISMLILPFIIGIRDIMNNSGQKPHKEFNNQHNPL